MRFCARRLRLLLIDMLVLLSESACRNVNPSARLARRSQLSLLIKALVYSAFCMIAWFDFFFFKTVVGMRNSGGQLDQIHYAAAKNVLPVETVWLWLQVGAAARWGKSLSGSGPPPSNNQISLSALMYRAKIFEKTHFPPDFVAQRPQIEA